MEYFKSLKKKNNYNDISCNHIFVLAGGQTEYGEVNNWVKERLNYCIYLYKIRKRNIYCIGGGTYHKAPILNDYNYVIFESCSCANYLINNGVNVEDIKKEWSSYDTIGNGFFSFTNFIVPLKLKNICILSSEFHLERVKIIFNYMKKLFDNTIHIEYINSFNNMDSELLRIRVERENKSIVNFKNNIIEKYSTVVEFINWFYKYHKAYNCSEYIKDEKINSVIKSY